MAGHRIPNRRDWEERGCGYHKAEGDGGSVTMETCKAQLLYEIQGPYHFNVRMIRSLITSTPLLRR
jgi:hypothetical protein